MSIAQKLKIVLRLWHKSGYLWCIGVCSLLNIIYVYINSKVLIWISDVVSASSGSDIKFDLIKLISFCIVQIVLSGLTSYLNSMAINNTMQKVSVKFADKIISSDSKFFCKFSSSEIQVVFHDIKTMLQSIPGLMGFVNNCVKIIVSIYSICLLSGWLVIPIIVIYGVGGLVIKQLFKRFDSIYREAHQVTKETAQKMENIVLGFIEMKIFNTQDREFSIFKSLTNKRQAIFSRRHKLSAVTNIAFETIDTIGLIIAIIYSIVQINNGGMNPATGVALVMFVFRIIDPLIEIIDSADMLSQNLASVEMYNNIMNFKNDECHRFLELNQFTSNIKISNINFAYDNSDNAIKDINIEIKKGQKIGICGESGGGKSTLFKLLNRFYKVDDGNISIDGFNINDITDSSFSNIVGSVPQDTVIFPGSIKDNILYVNENCTEHELISACKKANIYDFIQKLPEKFNTQVGNRGLKLSGGQKQRIALARLFLKNPEIIILDEATSALDNESEKFIQDAINNLQDKTIIMIAHRLSTLQNCDVIYVLNNKSIVEQGSHDELMAMKGLYYKMYNANKK